MKNINFINKLLLALSLIFIFVLSGCSNDDTSPNNRTFEVNLEEYSLISESFPDILNVQYLNGKPVSIESNSETVAFSGITIGDTLEHMESIMNEKYESFYSIHDTGNPNIGWYVLNDKNDIVIFDFVADDDSYYNEPSTVNNKSKICNIIISNLKYFD